jgi:hypothetical protein
MIDLPNNIRALSEMDDINTPLDYINASRKQFSLNLVCKITDVDENIDSCVMKGSHENVGYINTELDFCVYLEAIAYNDFDDIVINVRHSFGEDRSKQKKCLELYRDYRHKAEAVLLKGDTYTLVDNQIVLYDPEITRLGFKYVI